MIPHRLRIALTILLGLLLAVAAITGKVASDAWKAKAAQWKSAVDSAQALAPIEAARYQAALDRVDSTQAELDRSLARSRSLAAEAERLRRERREVVIEPSVPGEPPTVGDTLAACRRSVALCEQEAALEKGRADSLELDVVDLGKILTRFRADVVHWQQTNATTLDLLNRAESLLAAADPPCYLAKAGPIRLHCLGRKDTAALAAAGALLLTSTFSADPNAQRWQRSAAAGLVLGSLVLW